MFKIKVKDSVNEVVLNSVAKLGSVPVEKFKPPVIFTFGKIKKEYFEIYKEFIETKQKYILAYCKKDEKDNPIIEKNKGVDSYTFDKENGEKFVEALKELGEMEYSINANKLSFKLSEFPEGIFTGDDFINLETMIDFIDDFSIEEPIKSEKPSKKDKK